MKKSILLLFVLIAVKSFAQNRRAESEMVLSIDSLERKGEVIYISGIQQQDLIVRGHSLNNPFQVVVFRKRTKEERDLIISKQIEERKKHRTYPKSYAHFIDRSWYELVLTSTLYEEHEMLLPVSTLEKGQYILEIDSEIRKSPRKNSVIELIVQ